MSQSQRSAGDSNQNMQVSDCEKGNGSLTDTEGDTEQSTVCGIEEEKPIAQDDDSKNGHTQIPRRNKAKRSWSFRLTVLTILLMIFITSMNSSALAIAIPIMSKELGATTLEAFWVNIAFMLVVTVVQPIYTSTSDIISRKLPLYAAFALFAVGSMIFALARSMAVAIMGRAIQGLGCGGLNVLNEILIADITTLKERPFYLGLAAVPMAIATVLGPFVGALFAGSVSWRWIGWINLPLVGICLPLTIFFMKLKPMPDSFREQLARIDWLGMALFAVDATLFTLPVSWAGTMFPWNSWGTIVPLVIGVVVLCVFAWYESKPASPIFPYRIFSNRTAAATLAGGFLHGLVMYTILQYLPLFYQAVCLQTPVQSAVSLMPIIAALMAFSGLSPMVVELTRRYLWEMQLGWVLCATGVGLWGLWGIDENPSMSAGFQIIVGIGLGTLFTVPPIPMQASVARHEDQGLAAGILAAFRLFGALIGLAVWASAFSSQFVAAISALELPDAVAILSNPNEALGFIPSLRDVDIPADVLDSIKAAYMKGIHCVLYILTAFGAVGFFSSLFAKELSLESEEEGRQAFEA